MTYHRCKTHSLYFINFLYYVNKSFLAKIVEIYETFRISVKSRLHYIIKKMLEYLEDPKTVNILLKPIQVL